MPPVKTAQQAIEVAEASVQRYHHFRKLKSATKGKEGWVVIFDVGVLREERVRIRIDPTTGDIIEYTNLDSGEK
jgi:hypothetical protein